MTTAGGEPGGVYRFLSRGVLPRGRPTHLPAPSAEIGTRNSRGVSPVSQTYAQGIKHVLEGFTFPENWTWARLGGVRAGTTALSPKTGLRDQKGTSETQTIRPEGESLNVMKEEHSSRRRGGASCLMRAGVARFHLLF